LTPDAQSLDQLAKSGSDLGKLHQFDFLLRFPSQNAAERASLELVGFAFDPRIERGKTPNDWVIHAIKKMYPIESDLNGLREKLDAIAATGHGTYEGWKAKVFVPKPAG
jgi:hypothetical protein